MESLMKSSFGAEELFLPTFRLKNLKSEKVLPYLGHLSFTFVPNLTKTILPGTLA
jgi:hypothetical protein